MTTLTQDLRGSFATRMTLPLPQLKARNAFLRYRNKIVRDLVWVMESPHMLTEIFPIITDEWSQDLVMDAQDWLAQVDENPRHLLESIGTQKGGKMQQCGKGDTIALGFYFGYLIEYWIRYCPILNSTDVTVGKQLIATSGNHTIGQLKFLFRSPRISTTNSDVLGWHIECSVKFFLLTSFAAKDPLHPYPLQSFVGPHLGENLVWRLAESKRKLELCKGGAVVGWLNERLGNVSSRLILKGYLYYPLSRLSKTTQPLTECMLHTSGTDGKCNNGATSELACSHLRGWWTTSPIDLCSRKYPGSQFFILSKLHWLSSLKATRNKQGIPVIEEVNDLGLEEIQGWTLEGFMQQVSEHFKKDINPLCVAELVNTKEEADEENTSWLEVSRGFVLHPAWDPSPLLGNAVRFRRIKKHGAKQVPEYAPSDQFDYGRPESVAMTMGSRPTKDFLLDSSIHDIPALIHAIALQLKKNRSFYSRLRRSLTRKMLELYDLDSYIVRCLEYADATIDCLEEPRKNVSVYHLILDAIPLDRHTFKKQNQLKNLLLVSLKKQHFILMRLILKACRLLEYQWDGEHSDDIRNTLCQLFEFSDIQSNTIALDLMEFCEVSPPLEESFLIVNQLVLQRDYKNVDVFARIQDSDAIYAHISEQYELLGMYKSARRYKESCSSNAEPFISNNQRKGSFTEEELEHVAYLELDDAKVVLVEKKDQLQILHDFMLHRLKRQDDIKECLYIGMDCEWKPQYSKKERTLTKYPVSLIQISIGSEIFLLDIQLLGAAVLPFFNLLHTMIQRRLCFIFGFHIQTDYRRLHDAFPILKDILCLRDAVDIRHLAHQYFFHEKFMEQLSREVPVDIVTCSLSDLSIVCLGKRLRKTEQCSDWSRRPLSQDQIRYAALDAYCVTNIVRYLHEKISQLGLSFEDSLDAVLGERSSTLVNKRALTTKHVEEALQQLHLSDQCRVDPISHFSVEAPERNLLVKTIGMRILKEQAVDGVKRSIYCAVVLNIESHIDMALLAAALACPVEKIVLVSETELVEVFGYKRGCLGPIGLRSHDVNIIIDEALMAPNINGILCGAGAIDKVYSIQPLLLRDVTHALVHAVSRGNTAAFCTQ